MYVSHSTKSCLLAFLCQALDLNPDYLKVRLRRAQCFEHEDRLEEALEGKINEITNCVFDIFIIYFCIFN